MAIVREDGRHVVLIIDESDVLAERGALGDLRALLNLEYEERRLLTLVLVGPNEIQETLARESGLAARVDVHVRLRPLDADAATQYLTHRIRRVGGSPAILDPKRLGLLIERAGGIPRRMNTIADNALFEAFLAGRVCATHDDVRNAADELDLGGASAAAATTASPASEPRRPLRRRPPRPRAATPRPRARAPPPRRDAPPPPSPSRASSTRRPRPRAARPPRARAPPAPPTSTRSSRPRPRSRARAAPPRPASPHPPGAAAPPRTRP